MPSLLRVLHPHRWPDCWLLAKLVSIAQWTMHTIIQSDIVVCSVDFDTRSAHVMKTWQFISHKLWQLAGPIRCNMQLQSCRLDQLHSSGYLGSCTPCSEPSIPPKKRAFSLIGTLWVSSDVTVEIPSETGCCQGSRCTTCWWKFGCTGV